MNTPTSSTTTGSGASTPTSSAFNTLSSKKLIDVTSPAGPPNPLHVTYDGNNYDEWWDALTYYLLQNVLYELAMSDVVNYERKKEKTRLVMVMLYSMTRKVRKTYMENPYNMKHWLLCPYHLLLKMKMSG